MIKISILYPRSEDTYFDVDYYCKTHMPMVKELFGNPLKGVGVDAAVDTQNGNQQPYHAIGHLFFETVEDFQAAMATHGPTVSQDKVNYTNIQPVLQINEVRLG